MTKEQIWNHYKNWKFLKEYYKRMWIRSWRDVLRNPTDENFKKCDMLEVKMDKCEMYGRRCLILKQHN